MNQATRRDTVVPEKREPRTGYRAPASEVIGLTRGINGDDPKMPHGSGFSKTPDPD